MSQYYLRGFSRMGGDEYFLAANLGIHKYVIDIPLGLAFITGFILCLRALGNWRIILKWLGAIILGSFPSGLLLMKANSIILAQVNEDNPLFRPLFGWSLPFWFVFLSGYGGDVRTGSVPQSLLRLRLRTNDTYYPDQKR